jgi:translation initiation factor 6 (eIF-6)
MRKSKSSRMTVAEAVALCWRGLDGEAKEELAAALGVGVSTIYQWSETKEDGTPRLRMPAELVGPFCAGVGNDLLIEVIRARAEALGMEVTPVGHIEVMSELVDPLTAFRNAIGDGVLTPDERALVLRELDQARDAVARCDARPAVARDGFERERF